MVRIFGIVSGQTGNIRARRLSARRHPGICFANGAGAGPGKFRPMDLIIKARDGGQLTRRENKQFYLGVMDGSVSMAQFGAWWSTQMIHSEEGISVPPVGNFHPGVIVAKTISKIPLTRDEIFTFIRGVVAKEGQPGYVNDFQCGAWLMAVQINGLTDDETAYLSEAMWKTGGEINLSRVEGISCDKHAAGGSSDNTSYLIAALLACFGIKVPMMSGRMLAHTGGTLDKLESIPGFMVNLDEEAVIRNLQGPGLAIFGQMPDIAPADGRLYRLRQLTGTVQSIPLIASSIISKKLAEGAQNIVLVGTFGSGAFARNPEEAQKLSDLMMKAARKVGRNVVSFLVDMSQPLTPFIGPALEMKMAIRALKGQPDPRLERFYEVSIAITAQLLVMSGIYRLDQIEDAKIVLREKLRNGEALTKFREMAKAQGGNSDVLGGIDSFGDSPLFKQGSVRFEVIAPKTGYVQAIRADEIGNAVNDLGAGRTEQRPNIDHGVGAADLALVGDSVKENGLLGVIYANDLGSAKVAATRIRNAYTIGPDRVEPNKVVYAIV